MTSSYLPAQSAGHPISPNRIETFLQDYQRGKRNFRYLENLLNIDLSGKNLSEPNSKGEYLNLSGTYLRCANLSKANLSRVNLSGTDLRQADLSGEDLSETNLSLASPNQIFRKDGQNYIRTNLSTANLNEANLSGADLDGAILSRAILTQANLSEANLLGSIPKRANLSGANLRGVKLFLADLSEANLSEANLTRAKLSFANLSKANLTGAKLYGADLREATLHDTKFENAYYDERTQFPKTFDPEKNGLKKEWISSAPAVELTEVQSTHTTLSLQNPISVKPTEVQPSLGEKLNERLVKGEQESADQLKAKGLNWQSKKEKRSKVPTRKISRDELQENKDKADKIGFKGEAAVNAFLNKLQQKGQIDSYEWVSDLNATSSYDFWVSIESQPKTLIDVKSTNGKFDNVIHISLSELQQMGYGDERYDIYRVFEIDETNKTVKLRILENVRDFAKSILNIFDGLPTGVLADSISVEPSTLDFLREIITIQIPD